jgi:membrane protease YdiL (CAAX protease family)
VAARSFTLFERRPLISAVVIFLADLALILIVGAVAKALGVEGMNAGFVALCVESVLLVLVLAALRWWRAAGFTRPSEWRELRLLWVPAAVFVVLPLVVGLHALAPATAVYLVVAYALTGFTEEGLYRGVLLRVLGPLGTRRAVLLSALFFGAAHLVNLMFRSNPFLVFAQAVGAFSEGVGFGALRLRTNTIWPLIAFHFFEDLLLRFTRLPPIPLNVLQSVVMLVYGIYLLRNMHGRAERPGAGAEQPRVV